VAPSAARNSVGLGQAMIVAGIGCRKGASAANISAAIDDALTRAGLAAQALDLIAAPEFKAGEHGLAAAAVVRGVPLVLIAKARLEEAGARTKIRSERVRSLAGVPSVAEAAALAAGGPAARLLVPRITLGAATCALAVSED
jgi:cobalt-precorrin 5A hydrolase